MDAVTVTAPASSANLGAGFDCLALALEVRCRATAAPSDRWLVAAAGHEGFVEGVARRAAGAAGPLRVEVSSDIPIGKGLGSSAAVAAAVGAAARSVVGADDGPEAVFELVAAVEGHADNAAAAVFGGLVAAGPSGGFTRVSMHPALHPVVAVPAVTLPTAEARAALPKEVPFDVAARSVARAILLVEGLRSGDKDVLGGAGYDELQEPHRARLRPVIGALLDAARGAGAWLTAISGAGPSVLALVPGDMVEGVSAVFNETLGPGGGQVLAPPVAATGLVR